MIHWVNGKIVLRCSTCKCKTFENRLEINSEGDAIANTLICTNCLFEYGEGWISDLVESLLIEEGNWFEIKELMKSLLLGNKISYSKIKTFLEKCNTDETIPLKDYFHEKGTGK